MKKDAPMFAPTPRKLAHPPERVPVLEWWAEDYDHVFVVLNPFFRVEGFSPRTAAYGPMHAGTVAPKDVRDFLDEMPVRANEAPKDFCDEIKHNGQPIRWDHLGRALGLSAPAATDFRRNVWLWTLEVDRDDTDPELFAALERYCDRHGIYAPEEDQLPAILEPVLHDYLTALNLDEVTLWNEWRNISQPVDVATLSRDYPCLAMAGEKNAAITAPGLILSWAFDDVSGLLALTDEMRQRADPAVWFEGFWLGAGTYPDVFNPAGFLERKRRNLN